ncbi:DDE_3 domain-containing protein [Trichonephila clavipes]|nr:DDE_3 domain-containing protein [Trichonephila clavipes]
MEESRSDESRFLNHHIDSCVKVHHFPQQEQLLSQCTQINDVGIMLWRAFSLKILGPLVLVEGTVKVVEYLSIIADQLYSYMASVFPTGNEIFQQDCVPCQKARIVLERYEKHKDELRSIFLSPNSGDLNLIGHILVFP